ncbi:hypothetical protein NSA56_01830 [Oceanobacillus caeni]|uniref:hypothetical protein n=1 Tax=Oceanobacillus caeni TaxID=405946 RepID=UPI00214A25A3|nr:hypothetical protein [Oceanobacillus caeni]MCR1833136.1 hypothetical protein [Oceanobacillus caeni]
MINHLLQQDCKIVAIERDRFGDVIESEPIPAKCRAKESFNLIKNNAGEEVVTSIQFWMNPDVDLSNENLSSRRIKYDGIMYTPISVRNRRDTYGKSIFKVVSV